MSGTGNKFVVLIPTRDRPAYLNLTVESVLEQAKRHGHKDIEIVVSDVSEAANARQNEKFVEKLRARFPDTPIHYYPPGEPEPIKRLLKKATQEEKKAFEELVPKDGHYGAHRNRLALLGIYHGGKNAAYLHLDDDTPLMSIDSKKGVLPKNLADVLGAFKAGFREAVKRNRPGFYGSIAGVPDSTVSLQDGAPPGKLRDFLRDSEKSLYPVKATAGPARVLRAEAMRLPYAPKGVNEDWKFLNDLAQHWTSSRKMRGLRREQASLLKFYLLRPSEYKDAMVIHIGIHGPRLGKKDIRRYSKESHFSSSRKKPLQETWMKLADRMMALKPHRE